MAGGGRRNAAGKAWRLSVMTEPVQWAFPAQPMPWRDAISRCSCNCQGGSGMGGWVVQCELGLTLQAGQAAGAKRRAPLASCRATQSKLYPGPGGLWPRPRCGSRLEFQTRGQMQWDSRCRGHRQRPGKVRPARSKPSCILCTLQGYSQVLPGLQS